MRKKYIKPAIENIHVQTEYLLVNPSTVDLDNQNVGDPNNNPSPGIEEGGGAGAKFSTDWQSWE